MYLRSRSICAAGVMVGLALATQPALSQVANSIPVTDPEVLRGLGFPTNADNVYMAEDVATEASAEVEPAVTPTSGIDYNAISAKEFIGRLDLTGRQWRYDGGPDCCVDLSRRGSERFADAQFELPTGSTLRFFRWWAFDADAAADIALFVFENCQPAFAAGPITINTIVSLIPATTGSSGNQSASVNLSNRPVNNIECTYLARVRFDAASADLALQKVRMEFDR